MAVYNSRHTAFVWLPIILLASRPLAQTSTSTQKSTKRPLTTVTPTPAPTEARPDTRDHFESQEGSVSTSFVSMTGTPTPTPSDNAPNGNNNNGQDATGLVNYYFVFFALIFCIIGLGVFFYFRKRNRAVRRMRALGQNASPLTADERRRGGGSAWANWNPERRGRYWHGRFGTVEGSREEGLNEAGEAPPPYLPKRESQDAERGTGDDGTGPAFPLQTLSRDEAGLKPPDYTETGVHETNPQVRNSVASASSSRDVQHPADR